MSSVPGCRLRLVPRWALTQQEPMRLLPGTSVGLFLPGCPPSCLPRTGGPEVPLLELHGLDRLFCGPHPPTGPPAPPGPAGSPEGRLCGHRIPPHLASVGSSPGWKKPERGSVRVFLSPPHLPVFIHLSIHPSIHPPSQPSSCSGSQPASQPATQPASQSASHPSVRPSNPPSIQLLI